MAVSSGLDSGDTKPAGFVDRNVANWLKDVKSSTSQVVDENGEPLVVYHGTGEDFNEFNRLASYYGKDKIKGKSKLL